MSKPLQGKRGISVKWVTVPWRRLGRVEREPALQMNRWPSHLPIAPYVPKQSAVRNTRAMHARVCVYVSVEVACKLYKRRSESMAFKINKML